MELNKTTDTHAHSEWGHGLWFRFVWVWKSVFRPTKRTEKGRFVNKVLRGKCALDDVTRGREKIA
jgi:hypothetical protein